MQTRIAARATDAAHQVPRSEARLRARFTTRIEREGLPNAAFTLLNLSPSGFMGECAAPVRAGSRVTLKLPLGGRAEADIRWALNGRIGCQLRRRLSPSERALVLLVTAKNAALSATGIKALVVAAVLAALALG